MERTARQYMPAILHMPDSAAKMLDSDGSPQQDDRLHRRSRSRSPVSPGCEGETPAEREERRLADAAEPWLKERQLSDVTLHAAGESLSLHRLPLAQHSGFFERLFSGPWQDRHKIDLDLPAIDVSLTALKAALVYIYTMAPLCQTACARSLERGGTPSGWLCPDEGPEGFGVHCRTLHAQQLRLLRLPIKELTDVAVAAAYLGIPNLQWLVCRR